MLDVKWRTGNTFLKKKKHFPFKFFFIFSKNIQLFNFTSKDENQKSRPWLSSTKTTFTRQLSGIESSPSNKILNESIINNSINDKNNHENTTVDEYLKRSNRAVSVEPNLISGANDIKYIYQQNTLPPGSTINYDSTIKINKQFTLSSETLNQPM